MIRYCTNPSIATAGTDRHWKPSEGVLGPLLAQASCRDCDPESLLVARYHRDPPGTFASAGVAAQQALGNEAANLSPSDDLFRRRSGRRTRSCTDRRCKLEWPKNWFLFAEPFRRDEAPPSAIRASGHVGYCGCQTCKRRFDSAGVHQAACCRLRRLHLLTQALGVRTEPEVGELAQFSWRKSVAQGAAGRWFESNLRRCWQASRSSVGSSQRPAACLLAFDRLVLAPDNTKRA